MARAPEQMDYRPRSERQRDELDKLWRTDPEAAADAFLREEQQKRFVGGCIIAIVVFALVFLVVGYWATH